MMRTLGRMYLGTFVLCCLGSNVFGAGAAMNTLQKNPTKLIAEALLSDPAKLWLSHSRSQWARHIEILEVRGIIQKIGKCQKKKPDEDMMMELDNRKKKPVIQGKQLHYIGQTIVSSKGKNKVIITNRKQKSTTKKNIFNDPLMKRNKKKFVERFLGKARNSKISNKRQNNAKYRKAEVMMEQDEEEMYSVVKRNTPMSRRIEFFRRPRRNHEQVRKRKALNRRANSFKKSHKSLERMGSIIPVSPNGDSSQELLYSADGEVINEEATTIKNGVRGPHSHSDSNTDRQSKENIETFSTVVTTTISGLEGSEFWTHATTTETEILAQQEYVTSNELYKSYNKSDSSEPSINITIAIPVISLTSSQNEVITNKVTLYVNENRGDGNTMETTLNRQMTTSWDNRVLEPTEALPTTMSTDSWIKTPLNLQPGGSIVDDQMQLLLPNNSVIQEETSGDSEVHIEQVQNETLQVTETTNVPSTDSALPYPTGQYDGSIINTVIDSNEEMHDSVFSPLEMVMSHGSETKYCKPGYKYHAGACKSMCDMGDFFCENGGQCVIVENLGAMCRCHQTNNLCYKGECCRLSLTPLQLICVIGSCCIFVSVFLGSISLLIRRMDIKAVSKSVRTSRLWISTLMPGSRSSSFSHFAESDHTSCSEYDSADFSSFNHKEKVTHDGVTLKSERTRL